MKSYDEFSDHIEQRLIFNKQQEIEKQRKINQQIEEERIKKQERSSTYQDPFYKNITIVANPERIDALINKQNILPESYVPNNLVLTDLPQLDNRKHYLVDVVYHALKRLISEANDNNYTIVIVSAYRSYQTQSSIYNRYVQRNGQKQADTYSARPGHSEHQSGLAVDVSTLSLNGSLSQKFGSTLEGVWIANNAHRYGFILRYPINKSHLTGYMYEPWHLRYVGVDLASDIYQCQCTYEEYLN